MPEQLTIASGSPKARESQPSSNDLSVGLLDRARALGATLVERGPQAAALRRIPDETMRDFQDAGFFSVTKPARYGGFELDPSLLFDLEIELGSYCTSSAWVLGVLGVHTWQLALFPEEAQDEVWGEDPDALISSSYMPVGKVARVDGGFRLSGRWSFSSGCDHCSWIFLGGFAPVPEGSPPDMRTFLLPRRDYTIEDNWFVTGLRATGSKDIVVNDVFVPEHRTHKLIDGFKLKSPGNEVNRSPVYRLPFGQIHVRSVSSPAIGAAEGALRAYLEETSHRIAQGDGAKVADDPRAQEVAAEAAAAIDGAKLILRRNFREMMELAKAGQPIPVERRVGYRYDSSLAVESCIRVVDNLFAASGSRAVFETSRINRFFQDVHAIRAHYANNPDKPARNYGRVQLGFKNADFFL